MATVTEIIEGAGLRAARERVAANPAIAAADSGYGHWQVAITGRDGGVFSVVVSLRDDVEPTADALVGLVAADLCDLATLGEDRQAWADMFGASAQAVRDAMRASGEGMARVGGAEVVRRLVAHAVAARAAAAALPESAAAGVSL